METKSHESTANSTQPWITLDGNEEANPLALEKKNGEGVACRVPADATPFWIHIDGEEEVNNECIVDALDTKKTNTRAAQGE